MKNRVIMIIAGILAALIWISPSVVKASDPYEEWPVFEIDNDTYSTYFNNDGTPTYALDIDKGVVLAFGSLNNKSIIIDMPNVLLTSKEGENQGILNN